ncbi:MULTISPECIES: molybdopterin cofactor-binding domain-containing protein [unclassified Clostridium]|uniref:xanthine dehydrogenase family protein molybdopterin-binding subunit n=1 Tax=unclassified Clostridium TaxID=2614128 RepID=UPI001C8BE043|nr:MULTISPECIES: molybdopterin cofactor-binding domain-containing protein [unclassified Clostridium]MBX9136111.1 molybdopterin-dependent oxidoreductase [Clostridium sp. K12(2020)]MBX9143257.1 molybdopterin-dependent oxidoreductase [Clostridium sp. K13]MDU2288971.1 molybdopterin cofactor-binding domain-containing protein [Clostridium celatum]
MVGKSVIRPDAYEKVLGRAIFPDDLEFENMLYAGVKRSSIAYGRVKSVNIQEIKMLDGVIDVIDYKGIPGEISHGVVFKDIPILVKDIIKRIGDCIVLVIAKDKKSLENALEKVSIEYEEYEGIFTIEDALKSDAPILGEKSNILYDIEIKKGNIEEGFKKSKFITVNTYSTQMAEHAFMQPEVAIANYKSDNTIDLYVATQYPHYDREEIARCLNIKENQVNVINMTIGGAFGGREDINPQCHAAIASYITKRPVKVIYSREESTISHSKRHPMKMYYKTGVDNNGKLMVLKARIYADTGAYASWGMNVVRKAAVHATGPYEIPNVDIKGYAVYTNNPFSGAMRGFGAAQVPVAHESQMDILAEKLNIHPLKFRNINTLKCGSYTATGQKLEESIGISKCIEKLASIDKVNL